VREHPIPQDLTGYRFHIVGNMTLKQFVEVAAGVVVSVILYNTNLAAVIKWPLILLSFGIGALVAWVPFEERPLDHWVMTFFSILYHPTKFFWRKQAQIPAPFLFNPRPDQVVVEDDVDLTPARQARIREYIHTVKLTQEKDPWEQAEDQKLAEVLANFDAVNVAQVSAIKAVKKPSLTIRVRELQDFTRPSATEVISKPEIVPEVITPTPDPELTVMPELTIAPKPIPSPKLPPVAPEFTPALKLAPTPEPELAPISTPIAPISDFLETPLSVTAQAPAETIITNTNLPFPDMPSQPNKLVGMVLDPSHKLVTGAIVEIKNLQGLVARAVKTNALGQFFISTPLESGAYIVSTEKDQLQFQPQQLTLTDQVVPPIQITAVA